MIVRAVTAILANVTTRVGTLIRDNTMTEANIIITLVLLNVIVWLQIFTIGYIV